MIDPCHMLHWRFSYIIDNCHVSCQNLPYLGCAEVPYEYSIPIDTFVILVAKLRLVVESASPPLLLPLSLVHLLERDALRIIVLVAVVHFWALLGCD